MYSTQVDFVKSLWVLLPLRCDQCVAPPGGAVQHVCGLHGLPCQGEWPPHRWHLHDPAEHRHQPGWELALHCSPVDGWSPDVKEVSGGCRAELQFCCSSGGEPSTGKHVEQQFFFSWSSLTLLPSPAVRWCGWRLCDHTGRLLCGVGGVCGDWAAMVALAGEGDEAAAGEEPWGLEVQSESLTIIHPHTNFKTSLFTGIKVIFIWSLFSSTLIFHFRLMFEAPDGIKSICLSLIR